MYVVGYKVYHHSLFLLIHLHSIGCKHKLFNFNQYNLRIYIEDQQFFVDRYCFVPSFLKAKFYGVPSRDIVKVGHAVGKRRFWNTAIDYGVLGYQHC
jgi:hypothetical protein